MSGRLRVAYTCGDIGQKESVWISFLKVWVRRSANKNYAYVTCVWALGEGIRPLETFDR